MIPTMIETYLRQQDVPFERLAHPRVVAAQRVAAAEHVTGDRMAKPVVVSVDGRLAMAVVPACRSVNVRTLAHALGAAQVALVPERTFAERFWPCEPGAEPPLGLFGVPIYVDADLARQPWVLMRAGTHEDAIQLETDDWLLCEHCRIVEGLADDTH
jgi:Ala-tRNA(Pro) deacylase